MSNWPDRTIGNPAALAISTSAVAFVTGLLFGIYSTRGYLITPELAEQRRRNLTDPFESEASDIDDSVVLDHAPNWANGEEADVRDGLRAPSISGSSTSSKKKKKSSSSSKDKEKEKEKDKAAKHTHSHSGDEECKMVLVVRTDLGMTKGKWRTHTHAHTHARTRTHTHFLCLFFLYPLVGSVFHAVGC